MIQLIVASVNYAKKPKNAKSLKKRSITRFFSFRTKQTQIIHLIYSSWALRANLSNIMLNLCKAH